MSQRYRIVNGFGFFLKSVTVIPRFDFRQEFLAWRIQLFTGGIDAVCEICLKLFLGIAEHRRIVTIHRDVCQVVELGKQRNMAKLADSGDKQKAFLIVAVFKNTEEAFQFISNRFNLRIRYIVQDRFVIFIN